MAWRSAAVFGFTTALLVCGNVSTEEDLVSLLQVAAERSESEVPGESTGSWLKSVMQSAESVLGKASAGKAGTEVEAHAKEQVQPEHVEKAPEASSAEDQSLKKVTKHATKLEVVSTTADATHKSAKASKKVGTGAKAKATLASATATSISHDIDLLRKSLKLQRNDNQQELKNKGLNYSHILKAQLRNASVIQHKNANLTREIDSLDEENGKLRSHAKSLRAQCTGIKADFDDLRAKLATAQEFANLSLERARDEDSPDLAVLAELETSHKELLEKEMHTRALDQIEKISMLSLSSTLVEEPDALLKTLGATLEDLEKSSSENEEHLDAVFTQRYEANLVKLDMLATQQAALQEKVEARQKLRTRLLTAVVALKRIRDDLQDKHDKAKAFWRRISA